MNDLIIQPLMIKKQVRRLKIIQICIYAWNRKQNRHSTCIDWSYNKKGCVNQSVLGGWRQIARYWLGEVIVELGDLETKPELENGEGCLSAEPSGLNDSDGGR